MELQINAKEYKKLSNYKVTILKNWELVLQNKSDMLDYKFITPFSLKELKENKIFDRLLELEKKGEITKENFVELDSNEIKELNIVMNHPETNALFELYINSRDIFVKDQFEEYIKIASVVKRSKEQVKIKSIETWNVQNKKNEIEKSWFLIPEIKKLGEHVLFYDDFELLFKNWVIVFPGVDSSETNFFISHKEIDNIDFEDWEEEKIARIKKEMSLINSKFKENKIVTEVDEL